MAGKPGHGAPVVMGWGVSSGCGTEEFGELVGFNVLCLSYIYIYIIYIIYIYGYDIKNIHVLMILLIGAFFVSLTFSQIVFG